VQRALPARSSELVVLTLFSSKRLTTEALKPSPALAVVKLQVSLWLGPSAALTILKAAAIWISPTEPPGQDHWPRGVHGSGVVGKLMVAALASVPLPPVPWIATWLIII